MGSLAAYGSSNPAKELRLRVYNAWIDSWLGSSGNDEKLSPLLSVDELAVLVKTENLDQLLDPSRLDGAVQSFQYYFREGKFTLGGTQAPTCAETNLLSEAYDPRTNCTCNGLFPVPANLDVHQFLSESGCRAISNTLDALQNVTSRQGSEWHCSGIFPIEKLEKAVKEIILCNTDVQPAPVTCQGSAAAIPPIQAPSRKPDPASDTPMHIYNEYYPTREKIKLCADAKYFQAMACGAGICDKGIAQAIADSGNDILIGDYCEAADENTIKILQRVGAGALAFVKLCNLAGLVSDWQFNNLTACIIQFRVLGHYRDHSHARLPGGLYGSRMTGLLVHRYIDIAIYHGVVLASLATGEELDLVQYEQVVEACILINDLVDLRSDTMRKTRENVVLRGVRRNICRYLDGLVRQCLDSALKAILSGQLSALVLTSFCSWAIMSSHHKVFELVTQTKEVKRYSVCTYESTSDMSSYNELLAALEPYGSLGAIGGPRVDKQRCEMDRLYHEKREDPKTHQAWLADCARSLLNPRTLRAIVDVVHFEWTGDIGDAEYCP